MENTEEIVLQRFLSVSKYHEKKQQWTTSAERRNYSVVAFQFGGQYEHFHESGTFMMKKDSIMFYSPHDEYHVIAHEYGPCIAAHFITESIPDIPFTILDGGTIPQMKADFLRLYKAYNRRDEYSWCDSAMYLYTILGKLRRAIDCKDGYIQHQKYANVIRARDYLAENFSDPALNLAEAAAIAEVTPRRFGELFRRLYHMTPGHFVTHLRISAAEDMLRMKSYTIAEIAASVGYASPGYFCRVFTKEAGTAPSRWAEADHCPPS